MKKISQKIFAILVATIGIVFVSCSKDENFSFKSAMQDADSLIQKKQFSEALDVLKNAEDYIYNAGSVVSLYKRYSLIGEKKLGENILEKGLDEYPECKELTALYSHFLLRENRFSEAEKYSKELSGTKYGSIHSEVVLRKNRTGNPRDYLAYQFYDVFSDVYAKTKNPIWLVNAALVKLSYGEYSQSALLQNVLASDGRKLSPEEAFFWAKVQFDAANYDVCLRNIEIAEKSKNPTFRADSASLASDCYFQLGEIEKAEKARSAVINSPLLEIPDIVAVNSALWSYENGQYKRAYDLLSGVMARNPSFVPALLSYGKLAWLDSLPVPTTDLEQTLRKTTLRTEKMREYDERPKFLVEEAIEKLSKIEKQFQKNKDLAKEIELLDALIVERLSLYIRSHDDLPLNAKTSEIWKTLERDELGLNLYPSLLVNYAVQKLISYKRVDDARQLFTNYINAKYLRVNEAKLSSDDKDIETDVFGGVKSASEKIPSSIIKIAFGEDVAKSATSMEIWEIELAAYFALVDGDVSTSKSLYEYVLFRSGGVVNGADISKSFKNVSPLASISSSMNLAMIYSSENESRKALDLYGLAEGKCDKTQTEEKANILYRTAAIHLKLGDFESAKRDIDFSLSLNPQNAEARLLKRKIATPQNN